MTWYFGKKSLTHGNFSPSTAVYIVAVTPNNSTDLPDGICRAIRCITTGTVTGIGASGKTQTTTFYAAGEVISVGWQRITVTGTTATLEALY